MPKEFDGPQVAGRDIDYGGEEWVVNLTEPGNAFTVPSGVTIRNLTVRAVCTGNARIRGMPDDDPNRPAGDPTDAPDATGCAAIFFEDGSRGVGCAGLSDFGDGIRFDGHVELTGCEGIGSRIGVFSSNARGAVLTRVFGMVNAEASELHSPRSCFGFEPNSADEVIQDVILRDCEAYGLGANSGAAACRNAIYLGVHRTKHPVSICGILTAHNVETYDTLRKQASGVNGAGGGLMVVSDQASGVPLDIAMTVRAVWKRGE